MRRRYFTVKAWEKFSYPMQRALLKKYDIILTDHRTTMEYTKSLLKKFNVTNLNLGIGKVTMAIDAFDDTMDDLTRSLNTMAGKKDIDLKDQFWGKSRNSLHL